MLVQHILENGARSWPDREALACGETHLTYSQLDREANRLAHALLEGGVQRGDRVAILLENTIEAAVSDLRRAQGRGCAHGAAPRT